MPIYHHKYFALLSLLGIVSVASPTLAQSITADPDGTGTIIQHNGNSYNITGGTQSGANLFHSFTELGLSPTEIANFLTNPQIQNILGRVTGGNPSIIQGLIQVTGGNSNLLLMNPAGIIFTQGASLNVPSSFTATTADAIGFDSGIFTATGDLNYANLASSPNSFIFSGQNGTLVNAADLNVGNGNLALIGSSIINTGTIATPNGNITLTAVPDNNTVRINQEGMILGLEVSASDLESGITAADLPRLLTAPSLQNATGIAVESNGELRLTGSNINFDARGNVTLANQVSGNRVHLAAADDINPIGNPESLIRTHNGQYSAPTVTRFAQNSDPNAHIFLDATVPNYSDLLFGGAPGTTTTVVVPSEDGIAKITDTLTTPGLSLVDELHIVSEGSTGNFWLGKTFVSQDNISQDQSQMQQWSQGLNVGADILLYACLAAADRVGESLLNSMASYTGADVAGSTNLTGHNNFGGDWILERQVGIIDAIAPYESTVLDGYRETLAVFTATQGGDNGLGSLRQAVLDAQANTSPGDDEIRFAPGLTQITLTLAELEIDTTNNGNLTIDGDFNGANTVIIERSTAIGTPEFRIFNITGNGDVAVDALTLRNGRATAGNNGGGIVHNGTGTLTLTQSTVRDNTAKDGGGIYSNGAVNLINSTISGNTATDDGGGVYTRGAVNLINTTISGNSAVDDGGGVRSFDGGSILNSTITNNIADSRGNSGGNGGGVVRSGGVFTIRNSIIAGNFDNSPVNNLVHPDVSGTNMNGDGNNLIGDRTGSNGTLGTGSDLTFAGLGITDINQVLAPLGDYGGTTQTHALVPGSPALNAGDDTNLPVGITTDQRGARRNFNTQMDIGAFESQGFVLKPVGNPQSTTVNTAFANPLAVQLAEAFTQAPLSVADIAITFIPPNAGASGTAANGTVTTNANGIARTPFTANTIAGNYRVRATSTGIAGTSLNLSNTPDVPNFVTIIGGDNQTTTVNTAFADPLQVRVTDRYGNVVPNATVMFTAPNGGASGTVINTTAIANASGIAQIPFFANRIPGNYQVSATAMGIPGANFNLTNLRDRASDHNNNLDNTGDRISPIFPIFPISNTLPPTSITPPPIASSPSQDAPSTAVTPPDSPCLEAAPNAELTKLDLKIATIAGLMNAEGGSTVIHLGDLVNECNPDLAAHADYQALAYTHLQRTIADRIGAEYTALVEVYWVSSIQGLTAVIEVQPSPQPTFVHINNEEIFYLYEDGHIRDLKPEAVEMYQQQRWPQ